MGDFYVNALPVTATMQRCDLIDMILACWHMNCEVIENGAPEDNKWRRLHDRLSKQLEEWDDHIATARF